jgi:hypothetical protein
MIRKLAILAALAVSAGLATPALAGPGQCYDAYGRPVGPVYDTDHPNYGFIASVQRRGGSCTGAAQYAPSYRDRGYYRYNAPYDGYRYRGGYYNRYDGYDYSR